MCKTVEAGDIKEDWWQLIAAESTKAQGMLTCRAMIVLVTRSKLCLSVRLVGAGASKDWPAYIV